MEMLEGLCTNHFSHLRLSLERNFTFFANAAAATPGRDPREREPTAHAAEIDTLEAKFLSDFLQLLEAGHYKLLSAGEWDAAQAEDFLLTLPVTVNWDAMDANVLPRALWSERPQDRESLPPNLADRILIFHRGVDVAQIQGTYILRKVDLILTFFLLQPIYKIFAWIMGKFGVKKFVPEAPTYMAPAEDAAAAVTDDATKEAAKKAAAGIRSGRLHAASVNVERKTFARTFPTGTSVFKQLFKKISLQEATFKDVIILYRKAVPDAGIPTGEFDIIRPADPAFQKRNFIIKRFASIPIADLELVFPDKKIHMPPQVMLQMIITLVTLLVAVINTFVGGVSLKVLWPLLTMLGSRAAQLYTTANIQRTTIQKAMQTLIYDRTMASQEAVISSLTEEMARQRTRELMVAYGVLATSGTGKMLTPEELDARCEDFLHTEYGLAVDFTTEDALPTLLEWGLAEALPGGGVQALPLSQALVKLDSVWDSLYAFPSSSTPASAAATAVMNTGAKVLGKVLSTAAGAKDTSKATPTVTVAPSSSQGTTSTATATTTPSPKKKGLFSRLSRG